MFSNLQGRRLGVAAWAGMFAGVLAASARGDETQYVPNNPRVIVSVNFQQLRASKAFAELKNQMKVLTGGQVDVEAEMVGPLGIPADNLARLTMGVAFQEREMDKFDNIEIGIATTRKPVTAAGVIAAKKPGPDKKNVTYKEIKVGKFLVHQENFQLQNDKSGEVRKGPAFCVVEEKVVLFTDTTGGLDDALQKILERKAKPELSKNMQAGLKHADFSNGAIAVFDLHGMPARERNDMFRDWGLPDLKDTADSFQLLALKMNEKDKFVGQASLFCKDGDIAGKAKKIIEAGLAELKSKLKDPPVAPAPVFQEILKAARQGVEAVQVSVEANQVTASVSVAPPVVGKFLYALFAMTVEVRPAKEEKKEKR